MAVPPPAAVVAVAGLDAELAEALRAMPHATAVTVAVGYPQGRVRAVPPLTGYLVPLAAGRRVRACTVVTNKWSGRAAAGAMLFRLSLGGAGREAAVDGDERARRDRPGGSCEVLDIVRPVVTRVYRWRDACRIRARTCRAGRRDRGTARCAMAQLASPAEPGAARAWPMRSHRASARPSASWRRSLADAVPSSVRRVRQSRGPQPRSRRWSSQRAVRWRPRSAGQAPRVGQPSCPDARPTRDH